MAVCMCKFFAIYSPSKYNSLYDNETEVHSKMCVFKSKQYDGHLFIIILGTRLSETVIVSLGIFN